LFIVICLEDKKHWTNNRIQKLNGAKCDIPLPGPYGTTNNVIYMHLFGKEAKNENTKQETFQCLYEMQLLLFSSCLHNDILPQTKIHKINCKLTVQFELKINYKKSQTKF
jgi:hypothetical protein